MATIKQMSQKISGGISGCPQLGEAHHQNLGSDIAKIDLDLRPVAIAIEAHDGALTKLGVNHPLAELEPARPLIRRTVNAGLGMGPQQ